MSPCPRPVPETHAAPDAGLRFAHGGTAGIARDRQANCLVNGIRTVSYGGDQSDTHRTLPWDTPES